MQTLGFLTPLEIEHAVILSEGDEQSTKQSLQAQGYSEEVIAGAWKSALERELIRYRRSRVVISEQRREIVRRYFLLDLIARHGKKIGHKRELSGKVLIPGHGAFYGLPMAQLPTLAKPVAPEFADEIGTSEVLLQDIQWLREKGTVLFK